MGSPGRGASEVGRVGDEVGNIRNTNALAVKGSDFLMGHNASMNAEDAIVFAISIQLGCKTSEVVALTGVHESTRMRSTRTRPPWRL